MTRFGATARRDTWWLQPLVVFLALGAFVVYATWAAFQGNHYHFGPYLSPFYSPEVFGETARSWFGPEPHWWPGWLPWSPAFLILWAPGGFLARLAGRPVRAACYTCVSFLNRRHMLWAWMSLCWVAFSDLYVRLCATGVWNDWRLF